MAGSACPCRVRLIDNRRTPEAFSLLSPSSRVSDAPSAFSHLPSHELNESADVRRSPETWIKFRVAAFSDVCRYSTNNQAHRIYSSQRSRWCWDELHRNQSALWLFPRQPARPPAHLRTLTNRVQTGINPRLIHSEVWKPVIKIWDI